MKRLYKFLPLLGCLLCLLAARPGRAQTGAVFGFGYNAYGQIGDGTTTNRSVITPAFYISGVKDIAFGFYHTLALDSTGTVWAWGDNTFGQLGAGPTTKSTTPISIMSGVKAIAAGGFHSLALRADGTVWAWGYNGFGELGTGDTTDRHSPVQMAGVFNSRIKAISAGTYHSLILNDQSQLYGCGGNFYGQLAVHDYNNRPSLVFISQSIKAMAAGYAHSLFLTTYNEVLASGWNAYGQLGDGTTTTTTAYTLFLTGIRSISAGMLHSLAIREDGRVLAWGRNDNGELGMGDTTIRVVPTLMPNGVNAKAVAGGGYHSLVLLANGKVLATGRNVEGQLGDGTTITRTVLGEVHNASLMSAIAAGTYNSVILKPFTKPLATGLNNYGQLGINNTATQKNAPVPMNAVSTIIAVAAGPNGSHSLLLRADGSVWACGLNSYGQLGNGTNVNSINPVRVLGPGGAGFLSNIIAIAAGDQHSMALAADGTVYVWGNNSFGQLGLGDTISEPYPVQVPGAVNIIAIAAGSYFNLLLGDYGSVYSCGDNYFGQLGVGDRTDRHNFTHVNNSFGQIAISAGVAHSMSIDYYQGGLYTWGGNSYGQLGLGDAIDRLIPTFKQGTIASSLGCAGVANTHVNARGEVFVSGYNYSGMLGLGDQTNRYSWTYNPYLGWMIGSGGGYLHSLFLSYSGNVYASGYGGYGELGNGGTANASLPTYVSGSSFTTSMAGGGYHTLLLTTPRLQVAAVRISPSSLVGGTSATGTVTLSGVAGPGGQRVYLAHDTGPLSMPAYVDVAPTARTATFPVTTSHVSTKTVINVYALLQGYQASTTLTINP